MISERYAVASPSSGIVRRPGPSLLRGLTTSPAAVVRERLARILSDSTLVQLMLAMACIAFAFLLYLAQASQVSVLQYNIADLQAQRADLSGTNAALHASLTSLQSASRVDRLAISQLHMARPDFSTTIWISPSFPTVTKPRALSQDVTAAQEQSQPLAWMTHALRFVQASL